MAGYRKHTPGVYLFPVRLDRGRSGPSAVDIQNLLPVNAAVSGVEPGNVLTTLVIFICLFTAMLGVEISIMLRQIKKGGE